MRPSRREISGSVVSLWIKRNSPLHAEPRTVLCIQRKEDSIVQKSSQISRKLLLLLGIVVKFAIDSMHFHVVLNERCVCAVSELYGEIRGGNYDVVLFNAQLRSWTWTVTRVKLYFVIWTREIDWNMFIIVWKCPNVYAAYCIADFPAVLQSLEYPTKYYYYG